MPVLDASVCVALFNDLEPGHPAAMEWLSAAQDAQDIVVAPVILLAEVAAALTRGMARSPAAAASPAALAAQPAKRAKGRQTPAASSPAPPAPEVQAVVTLLRSRRIVELFPIDELLAAHAAAVAARLGLRGADALYVALADQLGIPLVSFDHQQLKRGGRLIQVQAPTLGMAT